MTNHLDSYDFVGHTSTMLTQVAINRNTDDNISADILDVAETLAEREYGTGTRALVAMVRRSPLFQEIIGELRGSSKSKPARRKAGA